LTRNTLQSPKATSPSSAAGAQHIENGFSGTFIRRSETRMLGVEKLCSGEGRETLQFRPRRLANKPQAPWLLGGGEFDEAEQYRPHRDPSEHG
jgi:hypothetical protein